MSHAGARAVVRGTVIHGEKQGRALGYPTANIRPAAGDLPPFGIYAGRVLNRPAAISVGVRPTFGRALEPLLEAYILDFDGCLYGQELEVELTEFLRPERRFDSIEELVAQIASDVATVRRLSEARDTSAASRNDANEQRH